VVANFPVDVAVAVSEKFNTLNVFVTCRDKVYEGGYDLRTEPYQSSSDSSSFSSMTADTPSQGDASDTGGDEATEPPADAGGDEDTEPPADAGGDTAEDSAAGGTDAADSPAGGARNRVLQESADGSCTFTMQMAKSSAGLTAPGIVLAVLVASVVRLLW
jgi:hypothetical protein